MTKTRELEKAAPRSLYIRRDVLNAGAIIAWAKKQGFEKTVPASEMHVTVCYSRTPVDWMKMGEAWSGEKDGGVEVKAGSVRIVEPLGDKGAVVLLFASNDLSWRHQDLKQRGTSFDYDEYQPHVTITYDKGSLDLDDVEPYRGPIKLGPEIFEEIDDSYLDNIVEKYSPDQPRDDQGQWTDSGSSGGQLSSESVHNLTHQTGPQARQRALREAERRGIPLRYNRSTGTYEIDRRTRRKRSALSESFRIAKVDDDLGLVFGWAIVCKVDGEDYYDLNVDKSGERVPEHIPEDTMLKVSTRFMQSEREGNEMHAGPAKGQYVFAFPMTTDIAKALGIVTKQTGLLVAYKPPKDVLAKFKSGVYRGFSIEGEAVAGGMELVDG